MNTKLKKIFSLSLLFFVILGYQNCSQSFKPADFNESSQDSSTSSESETEIAPVPQSCGNTPHLGTETVRMYLRETGEQCEGISRTRVCNDGTFSAWSGSDNYSFLSCTVTAPQSASCGNTPHGDFEIQTFYASLNVAYGEDCGTGTTQRRTCNNGTFGDWDGPLIHQSCTVAPPANCGNTSHGQYETRLRYATATVPAGSTCQQGNQRRLCNNGSFGAWSMDYTFPSCSVDAPAPPPTGGNPTNLRMFVFGHSLIVHEHTPQPSEEKKVPHWLYLLSQSAGYQYTVDGQYGFLRQHMDFSNISPQWGFQQVPSIWPENQPFSQPDFNVVLSTPGNFIQYQAASEPYYDSPNITPLSATLSIFDQTRSAHPNIPFYIYENWPDMAPYGSFPNNVDFTRYNNDTSNGSFHSWFINYHEALIAARPSGNIKMIPVGPTLSKLFRDTMLSGIPLTSLYEDDAPHGQPSLYFLASLVTYMAVYQTPAPANFNIPNTVHPLIRDNYSFIVNFIWNELQNFNRPDGSSRVF